MNVNTQFEAIKGKVFVHPETKESFGIIRLPPSQIQFMTLDKRVFEAFAEDGSGNYFTIIEDGAVCFWNHETDELIRLAANVSQFISHCEELEPVNLDPKQVKSVWVNPDFAKKLGINAPKDGWIKKSS